MKTATVTEVEVFNDKYSKGSLKKVMIAIDNSDNSCNDPADVDNINDVTKLEEVDEVTEIESGDKENEIAADIDSDWVSKITCIPTSKFTYREQDDDGLEEKL